MKLNRKKIFFWLKIIVIIYCGIGIALYYLQERFLFHPQKLPADHVFRFDIPFAEMQIPVNTVDTISMVKFFPVDALPKGLVIYYHGNMQNIGHYAKAAKYLSMHGYEVWMPDYPGYGKSTGELSEKNLYRLADIIQQMAAVKYHSDSISIYGRSLGTGIAAYAASIANCKQLILETPYYSIPDLFKAYAFIYPVTAMSTYKIPTGDFLQDVKAPVIIFHGTGDAVIPYRCASKLKQCIKPGDKFITIKNGGHNNLGENKIYQEAIDSLLK